MFQTVGFKQCLANADLCRISIARAEVAGTWEYRGEVDIIYIQTGLSRTLFSTTERKYRLQAEVTFTRIDGMIRKCDVT